MPLKKKSKPDGYQALFDHLAGGKKKRGADKKSKPEKLDPDAIGATYFEQKDIIDRATVEINRVKELAMACVIQETGKENEPKGYVRGKKFQVGYFTRGGAADFDEQVFKDLYPKLYEKCCVTKTVTTTTFDPELLKKLHEKGKIKKEQILAATVVRTKASKVIDIKPL